MRAWVALILFVFIGFWLTLIAFLTGLLSLNWLPTSIHQLGLPTTTEALGNSLTILDGLFTSIAIVLGLIAILFQGKELKASTEAQTLQAKALSEQIKQQEASNHLGAYSARLQYLSAEIEHMENKISKMVLQADTFKQNNQPKKADEQWQLITNTRSKIERFRNQATHIDQQIKELLL